MATAPVNTIIAIGIGVIAIGRFLDKNLSPEWRARISHFLRTGELHSAAPHYRAQRPWRSAARTISLFFRDVLKARNPRRFCLNSTLISLFIIGSGFFYLYTSGTASERNAIVSMTSDWKLFCMTIFVPLCATLLIDIVAAYQSMFFLDMIQRCRALWQVLVLVYGNILLGIGLFSFTFPVVLVGLLTFEDYQTHTGILELQPIATVQTPQSMRIPAILALADHADAFLRNHADDIASWQVNTSVLEAEDGNSRVTYGLNFFTSRTLTIGEAVEFLISSFKALDPEVPIKVADQKEKKHVFTLPSYVITISVRNAFQAIPVTTFYRIAFSYASLLTPRALDVAQMRPVSLEATDLLSRMITEIGISDALSDRTDVLLGCDGNITRVLGVSKDTDIGLMISKCKKWAFVSRAALKAQAAMVASLVSSTIFITPFALSSLSITLLIYVVCFTILYTAMVRRILPKLFGLNVIEVEKVPLTLSTSVAFVFFVIPLAAIVWIIK
jgi:hypothetical protein